MGIELAKADLCLLVHPANQDLVSFLICRKRLASSLLVVTYTDLLIRFILNQIVLFLKGNRDI